MKKKIAVLGSVLAAAFAMSAPAMAGVIFVEGNNPQQQSEENILFNGSGSNAGPATTVIGRTNQSNVLVSFTSDELLLASASGQADLVAVDGAFRLLDISLTQGGTFGDLIFNLMTNPKDSGTAVVTVNLEGGGSYQYNLGVDNGNNFLTIYTDGGDRISSVNINSNTDVNAVDITDGKQFRISEVQGTSVPEPGTLALLGLGLLGIQGMRRKYHK